jgi:hypothetical protein
MNRSILGGIIFISFLFIFSCGDDDSKVDCSGVSPKYTNDIDKIVNESCATAGCHDAITKAVGLNMSTYDGTKSATKSDKFLKSIKHESGATKMPLGGNKLSDQIIKRIECWVQNGTPQ